MNIITSTELDDQSLVKSINMKLITIAAYQINVYEFTEFELTERATCWDNRQAMNSCT